MPGPVVAIPVGPAPQDAARAHDLLAALRAHEPRVQRVILVDDAPDRTWAQPGVTVIPNPRTGRGIGTLGGTCTATLAALAWAHANHRGSWVLRLDVDALVIGPFADRVEAAWEPGDGILGSCTRTPNGEPRDLTALAGEVARHVRPVWAWRRAPRRGHWLRPAQPHVRRVFRRALDHGYQPGEHCIAAGCAISAPFIAALAEAGELSRPRRWLSGRVGDDVMLGAMARGLGFGLRDFHEVFGVKHIGLAGTPRELLDRGFAVIHSTKNDPRLDEAHVRAFFAERRA